MLYWMRIKDRRRRKKKKQKGEEDDDGHQVLLGKGEQFRW